MIHSRVSSKAQTTIPRAVRTALGLREGDTVAYQIEDGRVILTRAEQPDPFVGNFSAFTEWADEADSAYDILGRT
ncbi:type II toxin-antitoxin system PrlF family antitoxin [Sphingobium algorifonticola]|uniref:AbrB/MazE/SpoVT family DNA-binding domain-containing protein n=1 Tax=Sphingobium algorifonticola TaxID=2008318 RepID=A0A437J9T3_9SPHN|nr:type II toxin-antitoxin system PrlF family antitoxin [Sphingobium algorifonticola]RVT42062.1 AbrB/MazE/SpoVT family DNA-binding domain-containing protein [Sphingobium algorifonticola]